MGADLFGSFAESTCAALVVGASFPDLLVKENYILYPIVLSAFGVAASFLTSLFATDIMKVNEN
jgi:Na+/H+-translocating membrane pyrophosphatase